MRAFVVGLGLICSTAAALAQSSQQQESQQQAQQQTQPDSKWKKEWNAQFSGENWSIEETRIEPTLVRFSLKMNRFYSGGAGEARMIFEQRAKALVRAGDFYSYQIVDYRESLNSFLFGGQRIAEGTIRLFPKI